MYVWSTRSLVFVRKLTYSVTGFPWLSLSGSPDTDRTPFPRERVDLRLFVTAFIETNLTETSKQSPTHVYSFRYEREWSS